jgi:5'-nucleotidase/UDP-sugar diphosphatase
MQQQRAPSDTTLQLASSREEVTGPTGSRHVDFTVLQLNDVYEAAPLQGGRVGGIARVATLRKRLAQENPNLLSVMAGDFLSPSVISATTGDRGRHMIEALNALGLSYATFGNHEFDLAQADLQSRIDESAFQWLASNVSDAGGNPFKGVARNAIVEFVHDDVRVRVALVAFCLDHVKKSWIRYQNPIESARQQLEELTGKADVVLALTHLTIGEDRQLGTEVPRLGVLMGGHEHEASTAIVGASSTPIYKADANARTVWVHRFRYDVQSRKTTLFAELVPIDESTPEDPETAAIVERWQAMTFATLRAQGIEPTEVVGTATEPLDGNEAAVRSGPTNLTEMLCETFLEEVPGADAVVFVSGIIRIDGVIPAGDITSYDVVRIFLVDTKLSVLDMPGALLRTLLDHGQAGKGTGHFLCYRNLAREGSGWCCNGEPLVDDRIYKIVTNHIPAAAFSYPPFKDSGASKAFDTRDARAIFTDRLRRDRAKLGG